jgi:hypothetical protein
MQAVHMVAYLSAFHWCHCCCRDLPQLTRVEVVVDPCHPCLRNPLPQPLLQPGGAAQRQPLMLLAAQHLQPDTLLGLYYGEAMTLT